MSMYRPQWPSATGAFDHAHAHHFQPHHHGQQPQQHDQQAQQQHWPPQGPLRLPSASPGHEPDTHPSISSGSNVFPPSRTGLPLSPPKDSATRSPSPTLRPSSTSNVVTKQEFGPGNAEVKPESSEVVKSSPTPSSNNYSSTDFPANSPTSYAGYSSSQNQMGQYSDPAAGSSSFPVSGSGTFPTASVSASVMTSSRPLVSAQTASNRKGKNRPNAGKAHF